MNEQRNKLRKILSQNKLMDCMLTLRKISKSGYIAPEIVNISLLKVVDKEYG